MKRFLALLLAAVMLLGVLAGCGAKEETPAPEAETTAPETEAPKTEEPKAEEPKAPEAEEPAAPAETIKVAAVETAYMDTYPEMWNEIVAAFTEATGINVELTTDKRLEDVIGPAMQSGEFSDVVMMPTGRDGHLTEQFIKDKLMVDITDVLSMTIPGEDGVVADKLMPGFTETAQTNPYYDGHTYLMPMFYSPCGIFYNAGLFEEKGYEVPKTWDEMWALGDKAAEDGISLFTYPTTGYFDAFFYAIMYSVGGPEFFDRATKYEEGIWDTPEAQTCFELVEKLATYTNPITPAQANDTDFKMNQQLILDNKTLFMPNGSWIVGEMSNSPRAENFKWGITGVPALEEGGDLYSFTWFEQIWVPMGAEHVDAAKQFIAFLYSDTAVDIFLKANAVQPVKGVADKLADENARLNYAIYDNGVKPVMGGFAPYASVAGLGTIYDHFFTPINGLVSGNVSAEDWIADWKEASDLMRENLLMK